MRIKFTVQSRQKNVSNDILAFVLNSDTVFQTQLFKSLVFILYDFFIQAIE